MKRLLQGLLVVALGLAVAPLLAYTGTYVPGAGINLTPHDIPITTTGMSYPPVPPVGTDTMQRICIYCHAPHNAYKLSPANGGPAVNIGGGPMAPDAFDYLPLWNHTLDIPLAYTMYQNGPGAPQVGPHASQAIQNGMVPGSSSLLCLSCHDGSIAVNSYGNTWQPLSSQSVGTNTIFDGYIVGKDAYLGNHHPIGFSYDLAQADDTELRPADDAIMGGAGLVRDHLYGVGSELVECGTCHSVHNKGNTGEYLLWRSDARSRMCLTCHDKGWDPGAEVP